MNVIEIDSLATQGYVEDATARRAFDAQCLKQNIVPGAAFVSGLVYAAWNSTSAGLVFSLIAASFCILIVWLQYRAPMIDRDTGRPMVKYKNKHPGKCVLLELVYVCPEKKTYFRRIWFRVGEF